MKRALVVLSVLVLFGFGTYGLTASDYDGGISFRAVTGENAGNVFFGITPLGRMDLIGGATFDNYTSASILAITESTINLVGAVGITGATTIYGSPIGLGFDAGASLSIATTDTTGVMAITHTGSGPTMAWTVPVWTFTNSTSMTTYTPSWVLGFDAGASWTTAVSDTTGNLAITATGSTKNLSITTAGAATLDFGSLLINSAIVTMDNGASLDNTADAAILTITEGTVAVVGELTGSLDVDVKGGNVKNTTAGGGLSLDATAAAAGSSTAFVAITGTTAAHAAGTPTDRWLDINPTIGINTGAATQNIVDLTFASPAWATAVATNLRGFYIAPTIGNATTGTNAVNLIEVAAITGDDLVTLDAIKIGILTGTGATEKAIVIGSGWDQGIYTDSPIVATSTISGTTLTSSANEGALMFSGSTSATISTSAAGVGLTLDALDAAAGSNMTYASITGSVPAHGAATPTSIFLDITPTVAVPTVTSTVHLVDLAFATPAYATGGAVGTYRGIWLDPAIGNATNGTNTAALIDVDAITGDAQVSLYGVRFGALTGTAATENAIEIGAGWDNGLNSASLITGSLGLTVTGAAVNLNDSSNFAVNIGSGTSTGTITIGSATTSQGITVQAGTGDLALSSTDDFTATASGTVGLFATAVENLVTLGNETGASSLHLLAGTGNIDIQGVAATTITIGDAAQTARIAVGESSATMTDLSLGTGVGAHAIHIGDGGTAAQVITMGSTSAASAITVQAGSGDVSITSADDFTTTALGTVNLFASAAENLITLGSNTTASAVTIQAGTGDVTIQSTDDILIASDAVAQHVTIGNVTGTSSVTIAAGSGGVQLPGAAIANTVNAGAVVAGTCTAVEYNVNGYHKTVLTLLGGTTFALEDKNDANGIKIYDFPQGVIVIHAVFVDATITLDTNVTAPYVMAIGTAIGVDGDAALTTTEANFSPSVAVGNGVGQDWHGLSAAIAGGLIAEPYNGTSSAPGLFVNAGVAAGDISGAATVVATGGNIIVEWSWLGDY